MGGRGSSPGQEAIKRLGVARASKENHKTLQIRVTFVLPVSSSLLCMSKEDQEIFPMSSGFKLGTLLVLLLREVMESVRVVALLEEVHC